MALCCTLLVSVSYMVGMNKQSGSSSKIINDNNEKPLNDIDFKYPLDSKDKNKFPIEVKNKYLFKVEIIKIKRPDGNSIIKTHYVNDDIEAYVDGNLIIITLNNDDSFRVIYDITTKQVIDTKIDDNKIINDFDNKFKKLQENIPKFLEYAEENKIFNNMSESKSNNLISFETKKEKAFFTNWQLNKEDVQNPEIRKLLDFNKQPKNCSAEIKEDQESSRQDLVDQESKKNKKQKKEPGLGPLLPKYLTIPTEAIIEAAKKYNFSFKQINPWDVDDTKEIIKKITGFDGGGAGTLLENIINSDGTLFAGYDKNECDDQTEALVVIDNQHKWILSGGYSLFFDKDSNVLIPGRSNCPETKEYLFLLAARNQFDNKK
jgi:hypothetical protein